MLAPVCVCVRPHLHIHTHSATPRAMAGLQACNDLHVCVRPCVFVCVCVCVHLTCAGITASIPGLPTLPLSTYSHLSHKNA